MRIAALVVLALAAMPGLARAAPGEAEAAAVAKGVTDGFIRPGYASLHQAADALVSSVNGLCIVPSEATLAAARNAFTGTALAWSRVEIIGFGPVRTDNRLERMLFWPDRKGIGLKQVQAILARKDPLDLFGLSGKSIALQGLGALEYVLFGTGSETLSGKSDPFRCAFGANVAQSIDTISAALDREWTDPAGIAATWAAPGPANPVYRSADETLGEALDIVLHGLELVRDVRLSFLGQDAADDRPKQALYWRSALTVASLDANLRGLADVLSVSGLGALLPKEFAWVGPSAGFEFSNAISALKGVERPVEAVLGDHKARGKLVYARLVTTSLTQIVGTRLAGALGIAAGFSSLDGD